ncbi:MAG: hypothetical protein AAGF01_13190 [Cyanobacteria bacterium P01_G01_bin.38]
MIRRVLQVLAAATLISLLAIGGCQLTHLKASQPDSSQWSEVEQAIPAVDKSAAVLAGSQFNQFFPEPGTGYERVYTQEKSGFAEAKLKQDGKVLAVLSISDTVNNPAAATKYQTSTRSIKGYPAAEIGSTGTGLLVNDRLQVKVLSRDEQFTATEREAWLEKFDLDGLADLVPQ